MSGVNGSGKNIYSRVVIEINNWPILTLKRQLRKKLWMRWFFDVSKVKESSFFKSDLTDPPSDFWCAAFGKYRLKPFQISFFSGFYINIIFWADGLGVWGLTFDRIKKWPLLTSKVYLQLTFRKNWRLTSHLC